jgi:hypothetical protein
MRVPCSRVFFDEKIIFILFGLNQPPREWNKKLHKFLKNDLMFKWLQTDHGVYVKQTSDTFIILAVYVDDLVIACINERAVEELKRKLAKKFKVNDLGPLKYIVGIEIYRDRANKILTIRQRQYVRDILKRFKMTDCKPTNTPLPPGIN